MNQFDGNTNQALVNTIPLFASVWIALYYVLRRNIRQRRLASADHTGD